MFFFLLPPAFFSSTALLFSFHKKKFPHSAYHAGLLSPSLGRCVDPFLLFLPLSLLTALLGARGGVTVLPVLEYHTVSLLQSLGPVNWMLGVMMVFILWTFTNRSSSMRYLYIVSLPLLKFRRAPTDE
ncbi:hypothetical protein HOY80DRAFT_213667 [Tuber brumale]|nr:hypothetical protein HOY80DRAFT_213667 [Tuber brumale]